MMFLFFLFRFDRVAVSSFARPFLRAHLVVPAMTLNPAVSKTAATVAGLKPGAYNRARTGATSLLAGAY